MTFRAISGALFLNIIYCNLRYKLSSDTQCVRTAHVSAPATEYRGEKNNVEKPNKKRSRRARPESVFTERYDDDTRFFRGGLPRRFLRARAVIALSGPRNENGPINILKVYERSRREKKNCKYIYVCIHAAGISERRTTTIVLLFAVYCTKLKQKTKKKN